MHPWLLLHPAISAYGVCLVAAFLAAWGWGRRRARMAGLDPSRFDLLMPLVLAAGLAGAWLAGVGTDALTAEPAHGAVLVGSLVAGTAAGIGYALLMRVPLGILGDIVAPPVALGIGIGRIGCFLAGCCFGRVCPEPTLLTAVRFPPGSFAALMQGQRGASLPVYPVQLYECALCVLLALALWRWRARDEQGVTGQKFLTLGLGYAALRFGLEFLRGDNPPIGGLTFSQWVGLALAVVAAITWRLRIIHAGRWHLARGAGARSLVPAGSAPRTDAA